MSLSVDIIKKLGSNTLHVSFESDGGVLGFLGPSGAGKSMTLKCIAGIEKPDAGKIIFNGKTLFDSEKKINVPPEKRHVGYLFQDYALFPNMTVKKNIYCGLHHEKDSALKKKKYEDIVSTLHLKEIENQKPSMLSGGQAQRTALARILVNEPDLLLLDEPLSAIDTHLRFQLERELTEQLSSIHKEVILVSHDFKEASRMCEKIGILSEGKVITIKDTSEIFSNPEYIDAAKMIGCENIAMVNKMDSHELMVPSWGNVRIHTEQEIGDDIKAIGIFPGDFSLSDAKEGFPVEIEKRMEDALSRIYFFRFENQKENPVLWKTSKDVDFPNGRKMLIVSPEKILLLK